MIFKENRGNLKTVRHHCHLTGKFRGAAHNNCNLNYKLGNFIPVFFHNLSNCDSHLFIKKIGQTKGNVNCIPCNEEKYISFTKEVEVGKISVDGTLKPRKIDLRFLDSFRFMPSSLDKLVSNLEKDQFTNLRQYYDGEQLELLLRKGVYLYDYVNSLEK